MIVYVSDFMNHHQFPLAAELYLQTKGDYRFVEIEPMGDNFKKAGYTVYDSLPYIVCCWKSEEEREKAHDLILNADAVVYEAIDDIDIIRQRLTCGKLTFECGERWLKKGLLNLLSPKLLKSQWRYHTEFYNKPLYRLCASAFAAYDLSLMHSFKNKCYKWGYFIELNDIDISGLIEKRHKTDIIRFITISRLINWKRNDLIIEAARILKNEDIPFEINIYGDGPMKKDLSRMVEKYHLSNHIYLRGNLPNDKLMEQIQEHDAMILASNRQEGWGAVVNEGMSNACPVIGSDQAGSVPYLITNGVNGLIFKSGDYQDLANQMLKLIENRELRDNLANRAFETMRNIWSPKHAAQNLILLINSLRKGIDNTIIEGPCSPA